MVASAKDKGAAPDATLVKVRRLYLSTAVHTSISGEHQDQSENKLPACVLRVRRMGGTNMRVVTL